MSIASAITALQGRIANAYTAIENKGGTLPATQDTANLSATIDSIPASGVETRKFGATIDEVFKVQNVGVSQQTLYLFAGCENLNFTGVTNLGNYSFNYCFYNNYGLKSVSFPDLVEARDQAFYKGFYGCSGLSSISFPALTTIWGGSTFANAFENCTALTNVSFPSLVNIGARNSYSTFWKAFSNCTNLTTISFASLNSIYNGGDIFDSVFAGCTNLVEIHFGQANQSAIEASSGYATKWGAPNANCQVYFDL